MTLVIFVGGYSPRITSNKIFYKISSDQNQEIWRESQLILPFRIKNTQCVLTNTHTMNPNLTIIGGINTKERPQTNHWNFSLSQVIGENNVNILFLHFQRVYL